MPLCLGNIHENPGQGLRSPEGLQHRPRLPGSHPERSGYQPGPSSVTFTRSSIKMPEATPGRTYTKGGGRPESTPPPFTKAISRAASLPGRSRGSRGHTAWEGSGDNGPAGPALPGLGAGPGRESLRERQESGGRGSFWPCIRSGGQALNPWLPPPWPCHAGEGPLPSKGHH